MAAVAFSWLAVDMWWRGRRSGPTPSATWLFVVVAAVVVVVIVPISVTVLSVVVVVVVVAVVVVIRSCLRFWFLVCGRVLAWLL